MRIASWNVNGIRAVATKGFAESLEKIGADVIGFTPLNARVIPAQHSIQRSNLRALSSVSTLKSSTTKAV